MYFIFAWLQVGRCTTYCFLFPHLPTLMRSGKLSYLSDCKQLWHLCEKSLLRGWSCYFSKYLSSLSSKYWIILWIDLANAFANMYLSLIIQASLLLLYYSSLLPMGTGQKVYAHLCWGSVRSESPNCLFFDSVERCWWIAYTEVVYSLRVGACELRSSVWHPIQIRFCLYTVGFLYNRALKQNLRGQQHVSSMEAKRCTQWRLPMSYMWRGFGDLFTSLWNAVLYLGVSSYKS